MRRAPAEALLEALPGAEALTPPEGVVGIGGLDLKPTEPMSGKGFGSTEAARGALSDWIVIEDGKIDLGQYAVEQLALSLDPFPRKPGAEFVQPEEPAEISPFAALKALKPQVLLFKVVC